jgi:hypothetical protein
MMMDPGHLKDSVGTLFEMEVEWTNLLWKALYLQSLKPRLGLRSHWYM